ncbi:lysylphosphatidylglycerol synthase domain-containing protein [Caballeronia sp. LZ035]|uniref:lysylphosphatidylglycerol synthase domain-containing protein n=1 Tax=Caballeronia sp. LZ035 TaxID=3038568 RepID=UPI00285C97E7|nr:lysylphosphatidylglycerol synthase domain-containing protein [Caballeronia sp. LZ035]MDR5761795.1 lysylphosphatidylglycerol synthase domain-containing protein [Caballeronia sp. LZ035]
MMALLRRVAWLRWPLAIALLIALALHEGVFAALSLIERTGPILLWLLPLHALPLLLDARAWQLLLRERVSLGTLWRIATVREAVGRLLPVLGIGGELIGIRLAMRHTNDLSVVSASVIVETLVTMAVQVMLALLGLVILCLHLDGAGSLPRVMAWGLAMSLPIVLCAFAVAQRGAPFHRLEGMARRWIGASHELVARLDGRRLDGELRALLGQPALCARAFAWQLAGYVLGAAEIYAGFGMLGHPVPIAGAIAIEALTQCVRNAVFILPAGLGVQEAAIVAVSALFGIDRETALSLALVRRAREFAWGGLALLLLRVAGARTAPRTAARSR